MEFWHQLGGLGNWVGSDVDLVAVDKPGGRELGRVRRTIAACYEKPVAEVTSTELDGTMAQLAMQQAGCSLQEFFDAGQQSFTTAMVIRLR
ncbi:MAG: hypothetical protein HYW51_02510 [Candidatus Doudnabacteria bacterium]|nr:hypothetical protein [Candidatus Doudnabacteria bacterium]